MQRVPQQVYFYSTDGTPVYLGFGGSGKRGTPDYVKHMSIHLDPDGERKWTAFLNEEAILKFVALLEARDSAGSPFEIDSLDQFQARWLRPDDRQDLYLQFAFKRLDEQYDSEADEWREREQSKVVLFVEELARDMEEYSRWMSGFTTDEPHFWKRNAMAVEICNPNLKREAALESLDRVCASDVLRVIGNVARRGRIDLAVELLDRLYKKGVIDLVTARAVNIHHDVETPVDVTWDQLFQWAGLRIQRPGLGSVSSWDSGVGYSSSNYLWCFEDAFDEPFETIDFETMDFRDVQARLRRLAENLDRHFNTVQYPEAEPGTVIPNIALDEQQTHKSGFGGQISLSYTPTLPYNEARKLLLFAHKICFEDPIAQILPPIVEHINNRAYEIAFPPKSAREIIFGASLRVEPGQIHDGHLSVLRETLLNTQRLSKLIRRKIVIPHQFIDVEITESDWNAREYPRWPNPKIRHAMEDATVILGNLLAQGSLKGFGFPDALVEAAKAFRESEDEFDGKHWIYDFFLDAENIAKIYPPLWDWVDFLYRIMMYDRYHRIKNLGYSQYFTHPDGYKLLSIVEAADLAQSQKAGRMDRKKRDDEILVHRLESNLSPNVSILSDEDIIQIRLEEDLFEEWRNTIRDSLQAVATYEAAIGRTDAKAVEEEIRERMSDWSEMRRKRVKSALKGCMEDVAWGAAISVVTGLALSEPVKGPALALEALLATLRASTLLFTWRRRDKLISRHFLSIT
jgi:hypothetical protein